MSQHDYAVANGSGSAVRADINALADAIASQNSGTTAPATTFAYMFWADTTTGLMKQRNAANSGWISLWTLADGAPGNANLVALASLTGAANKGVRFTGVGAMATFDLTTAGLALLDDADATAQRATLGVTIGTNVQAYSALLAALAGLTGVNGSFIRFTGASTAAMQAIVGTVSQSGGVATGALFESGNNSNGYYERTAGGKQDCWHTIDPADIPDVDTAMGAWYRTATTTWTFPASFAAIPACFVSSNRNNAAAPYLPAATAGVPSTTTMGFCLIYSTTTTASIGAFTHAIGKWF